MKKNLLLLLCLFCLVNVCHAKAKDTFTVFQLNLWHGCTKVPNGDQGIIDVLDQMDADVVFLCEIRDGKQFIPHVIEELEKRGKHYYGETFDLAIGVLSKFKPDSWTKCCIVPGDEGRAMVKMVSSRKDCLFAFKTSSSSVIGISIFFQVVPLYPRGI